MTQMSLKSVLNKLTSMVLVMCMLLSLAAPAVGDEPLTQPAEETVYPEGSTVYEDGTVVYADGTIVYADGTLVYADGTTVDAFGTTVYPDGTAVYADGKIVYADGTTAYPDGTTVYVDGTVVYPDGTIVYADGTTVHADGTTVDAYGTTLYPDGTAVYADGRIVYVDGTTVYADGTTVYPDGMTVYPDGITVYSDGTTVYADGITVYADGTTIYPDGTAVYADGKIVYADGTTVYADGTTVYPDRITVYSDGTTVYPDGTTVNADGTTLYPDGTTVYPDDSADSVLEEEQVPLANPAISNTDVVTENSKETEEISLDPAAPTAPVAETQPAKDGEPADGKEKTESAAEEIETGDAEGTENTETEDTETEDTAGQDGEETAEPEEETYAETEEDSEKDQDEQKNVIRDVTLSGTLVDSDGYTYEVSVSYPADCGIPAGAQLSVEELIVGTDAYWDYINQSAAELGISPAELSLARAFDISFVDPETGERYQPTKDVRVSILLISTPVNTEEELAVLHFNEAGEVQAMDAALNGEAIEFETGSFSVFTVLQKSGNDSLTEDGGEAVLAAADTIPLTITAASDTKVYDGSELTNSDYTHTTLAEGDRIESVTITGSQTAAGRSDNVPSGAKIVNGDNEDVTENYEITYVNGTLEVTPAPVTLTAVTAFRNYDGTEKTVSGYTCSVDGLIFEGVTASGSGTDTGEYDVTFTGVTPGETTDTTGNYVVTEMVPGELTIAEFLKNELVNLEGSWANWKITLNPGGSLRLNNDMPLTLQASFSENQSIDYPSIQATNGVSYDYRGTTGTYVVPDAAELVINYRTRVVAEPGEVVDFSNSAILLGTGGEVLADTTCTQQVEIYPSASDVATTTGVYMVRFFVYGDASMQSGLEGAQFILLDENRRPMSFRLGENTGETVTFTTDAGGYADIRLDAEEPGDVAIEKNTQYYLEMIHAPEGYKIDNGLYGFIIKDHPDYSKYEYYNGDTLKVRLYPEEASLNVSVRFSGNYSLTTEQQNGINLILQKKNGATWETVETHSYSEFSYGSLTFRTGSTDPFERGATYRVIQENESPWDLDSSVALTSTYYLIVGSGTADQGSAPQEFTVTDELQSSSFNVIIDNEYEKHELTIIKMDKTTGARLAGAVFTVRKAADDTDVTSGTTDADGMLIITGGSVFESETLYYAVETTPPTGYLLPVTEKKVYFYFCNDPILEPSILELLPEGETAANLSETYESLTIDNQKEYINVPVMKTWQGNAWPAGVDEVVIGLYRSVGGAEAVAVTDGQNQPLTVKLSRQAPYNESAFTDLPAREGISTITYSIKEEHVYDTNGEDILSNYVQEYGVSDAGVYIVRNREAVTLTVYKQWYDPLTGTQVTEDGVLAQQSDVTFDVYRSTDKISNEISMDGISWDEMNDFVSDLSMVRSGLHFGHTESWELSISDLPKQDDLGNPYYYYVQETVPSFATETYGVDEDNGIVTIRNQVPPETVSVTVEKAALKDDPRPEAANTDFDFTLVLKMGDHPIRSYQVAEGYVTDWNGEVSFSLKPEHSIALTLPVGVIAKVTEAPHPEYVETAASDGISDQDTESGNVFAFEVSSDANGKTVTFTNTLRVICKVVDNHDTVHPFESFKRALAFVRSKPDLFPGNTVTVEMLEDYVMPATDSFDVREGETITLTTAAINATDGFSFKTDRTDDNDTAIITRGSAGESMLINAGTLKLENITLDGANIQVNADGGLVNSTGVLNLTADTTLKNSATDGRGGAIYSTCTVTMPGGSITGCSAVSGSAIYLASGSLNMSGGSITGNTSAEDGAVVPAATACRINLSGNPVIFGNENSSGEHANLYLGVDSDNVIYVHSPGLDSEASIGVRAMESHREIGEQFATSEYNITQHLDRFVNDLYGYHGKVKDGTATNVVWDGMTLILKKVVPEMGANPADSFTLTLSSSSIRRNQYTIEGCLDYTVKPAGANTPGSIELRNVRANEEISIEPLQVGSYTISEAESNYAPSYTGINEEISEAIIFNNGTFSLLGNSTVTVTNTRRTANVRLTKAMQDRLKSQTETQDFNFILKLTETNGTAVSGFNLAEDVVTGANGEASIIMAPSNAAAAVRNLKAPVGAILTITETVNDNYRITASGETMLPEGEPKEIADTDAADNVFAFQVTDAGADVIFNNERKIANIELSKTLTGKVSETESFDFTVTLTRADDSPASGYTMYRDAEDESKNITTDENGQAPVPFAFLQNESSKSVTLTIPEGTKLEVEETPVKKTVDGEEKEIYITTYALNGAAAVSGTKATIASVYDSDTSIAFTNARKMQTITVTNTVSGYSGNVVPFTYTATVTDGGEGQDDYNANGFTDGVKTFELTTGQSQTLTVPYGAKLTVAEGFIVGYETTVKRGNTNLGTTRTAEFQVTDNLTVAFTNAQLIGLRLVNNTSSTLEDVQVYVGYGTRMYRVNDAGDDQILVPQTSGRWATLDSIEAGKTAQLEIMHKTGVTDEQDYTVKGTTPAVGFYYTINNEPSFHETADPAILRVYDAAAYEVKGKLRYSVSDSTVTFTEQPLVSFDVNGGKWTTEMDGYHDRDGDRKVYQKAVDSGKTVERPNPDPVYPTAENIPFLGWTENKDFATKQDHTPGENISDEAYNFDTKVTAPLTLYAVWAKPARNERVVTVKNELTSSLTVTVTLTNDDPVANYTLYEDTIGSENSIITGADGKAAFTLEAGEAKNLHVPDGAKLVISGSDGIAYSTDFSYTDSFSSSFTIDKVNNDGTVSFIGGIFKITDENGNLLYDANGKPAVYWNLRKINNTDPDEAFDAYVKSLYTDANHNNSATPAAVKQLVDEYTIPNTAAIAFPNAKMKLTTAGNSDEDFPYTGVRDRATIYRYTAGANANCFTLASGNITLTEIILDGGSEQGVKIAKAQNGGLIYMNNASGVLNVTTGTTMRNCEFVAYDTVNNSRGGAIYMTNGTLNVSAGLFSNLHAYQGGAICVTGGTLNITGTTGSTQFENCYSERQDGGAIYYNRGSDLVIDGGTDKENPGVIFTRCVAAYTNGTGDGSDGGAIFATSNYTNTVTVKGCAFVECSAKTGNSSSTAGYGGGGICAYKVKGLTVEACTFESCDTLCGGGAVAAIVKYTETVENETVTINNCTFNRCNCKAQAGALAVYQDNNGKTNSATKLSVIKSTFDNCSSGTNNGSGGAIQCYLPCMVFSGSNFTDCWAGKEGGAVNNFYGADYTAVWPASSMIVANCRFIRCRAEDRYDTGALQHYGGGINTKVKTVSVTDSYFEDCVSTLKEGGALHIGGQGSGSTATITGSTFKNCMAKNGGGALLSSHETLTIEGCNFYGCSSSASNGGAVYHYRNSRGDSTQKSLTIKNSTFSDECSATLNGGAIWTRATTNVTLENLTIQNAIAGGNGGGVYLDTGVAKAIITGGSIKNCQAVHGSAVYVGKTATFSGDLEVSDNTVSDINDGAIHGGTLYFEGNVTVKGNTCSSDSVYDHDVLMQYNNVTTIYTTASGLGAEASIGVYVPDQYFNNRGLEGKAFGTYSKSDYLDAFFNDRDDELYGYQVSEDDTQIYWGIYICKITDASGNTLKRPNGKDAVYQRLTMAFDEFKKVTGGDAVYVKMLVERYIIRQTAAISNFPAADITLTTASASDAKHPYRGTEGTVCTISRTSGAEQLFKLANAGATFRLENITLDGRNEKTTETGNRRLIEATSGALVINSGTTMQYGAASNGGAINAADNAFVTINGVYDAEKGGATVKFINCTGTGTKPNGGAIRAYNLNIYNSSETSGEFGTAFINCSAYNGGAITSLGSGMAINGVFFNACHTVSSGGAVYHNNSDAAGTTTVKNCAFEGCYTDGTTTWAHGGAVEARAGFLYVEDCSFKDCRATSDGGAVYHGFVGNDNKPSGNRDTTSIKNTTFTGCSTTGTDTAYNYGGSVYTQAKTVEVIDSTFRNSTAANHGGALYCQSSVSESTANVSGTRFDNCSTTRSTDGAGGAIYSRNETLALQKSGGTETTISNCTAPGYSGAVYMETASSTLNIKDSTIISGCYANQGSAIWLKRDVTLNLTDSPEFTRNGYTTMNDSVVNAEKGACIYLAEGSLVNLSGSPKFNRNNITNLPRVVNGGIQDYVRQDLYLAGYADKQATSIHLAGELTGDTIWVWPATVPHRINGQQFATMESGLSTASLQKFRNALDDHDTGCTNDEYLAGVSVAGDIVNIYWDKMYNISFKKIDNKAVAVPGAKFTLYTDRTCTAQYEFASTVSADGVNDTNAQGLLLAKGTVDFASVPIGVYYMKETKVPTSFKDNDMVYIVLVGSPYLSPNEFNRALWYDGGPLDVENAATMVADCTTLAGKYFGIFPMDEGENGKADLSRNLAGANVGIVNIRDDFEAYFMKLDGQNNPLPLAGAAFTIYTQELDQEGRGKTYDNGYPVLTLWSRDGENYPDPVKSADGSTRNKMLDGSTVPKGLVYFRELPIDTYYLVETDYPDRNGSSRKAFFVENDRVFRLEVLGTDADGDGKFDFTLSEWLAADTYEEITTKYQNTYYAVGNTEAVCKLTDANDALLYELGLDGKTLHPAIYASLEEGFAAAQNHALYDSGKTQIQAASPLKLKCLKDFTISSPIEYNSAHPLTFTTAETSVKGDRYVFTTTRTTYNTRAEIKYSGDALITVDTGASLTLQNINLNGQKSQRSGRAVTVNSGALTILEDTILQNFKTEGNGGAVLMENGTILRINGGRNRSAVFSGNEAVSANGGALALSGDCSVSIQNVQFTGNRASNGGAIYMTGVTVPFADAVFTSNTASSSGGAIFVDETSAMVFSGGIIRYNHAGWGSAIYGDSTGDNENDGAQITISGGTITGNTASDVDGGAINAGGLNTRIYFEGSPYVFDNYDNPETKQQKNVVLSRDTNDIIRTTEAGLTGGRIGVYVIDGTDLYGKHGQPTNPFGTFAPGEAGHAKPEIFRNDRNQDLYGVAKEEEPDTIFWSGVAGSRRVILRKVQEANGSFQPKENAVFDVDTDANLPTHAKGIEKTESGEKTVELKGLTSGASGILWIGELPYGVYYLKETSPQVKTFILTVDENGVGYQTTDPTDPSKTAYSNLLRAQ